ncbi:MAG: hypothetical protein ACPGQS_03160 [Bradymonadia bacterium]
MLLVVLPLGIALPTAGYAADDESVSVPPDLLERYNQLVRRARAVEADGPGAVIKVYTEALVDPVYQAYGQIHLKLGILLKESGRTIDAAYHFKKCIQDHRVDKLDRSIICQAGYEDTTTTLELLDQPPRSKVVVLEPALFSGPIQSGVRLPLGRIRVVVESPGYFPHETYIVLESPTRWIVEVGMKRRRGPLVPDGFITEDVSNDESNALDTAKLEEPPADSDARSTTTYWIVGSLGAAVAVTGVVVGQLAADEYNQSDKSAAVTSKLRSRAIAADIAAWSGGSLAVGTLLWYFLAAPDATEEMR